MGRAKKASKSDSEKIVEMVDRLVAQVDPEVILAGLLGGIAVQGGLKPPFTRMLEMMSGSSSGDYSAALKAALPWLPISPVGGFFIGLSELLSGDDGDNKTAAVSARALVASGIMEGMIMMAAMKNPGTMEALGKGFEAIASSAKMIPVPL